MPKFKKYTKKKSTNDRKSEKSEEEDGRYQDDGQNDDQDDNHDDNDEPQDGQPKKKGKAKPFLKRKSKGVKFQKLNWNNVKSKTECWTKKSARSEVRDKSVPRDKSANRANKTQANRKPKEDKSETRAKAKTKTFNKIQSRIDTGIRRNKTSHMEGDDSDVDSFEMGHNYNIGQYADEDNHPYINNKSGFSKPSNFPPAIDIRRYQLNAQNKESSYHQQNPNYEVFSSEEEANRREDEEFAYNEMHTHYAENQMDSHPMYAQNTYEEDTEEVNMEMGK